MRKRCRDLRLLLLGCAKRVREQFSLIVAGLVAAVVERRGKDRRLIETRSRVVVPLQQLPLRDRRSLPVVAGNCLVAHEILDALRELRGGLLSPKNKLFDAALMPV